MAAVARKSSTKWRWLSGCGLALCALCSVCAAVWAVFTLFFPPLYQMEQVPSPHDGYLRTTLSDGNVSYVNDYEESALTAFGAPVTERIGLTWGGSGLYAIPGQAVSAYVLEYDPMYEVVYRNIDHPPFDWRAAEFRLMRLYRPGNAYETTDARIIQDVLAAFEENPPLTVPFQADGNYAGYQNNWLQSISADLPGLAYNFGVHISPLGEVFLAENPLSNQWFPAGRPFVEWVQAQQ